MIRPICESLSAYRRLRRLDLSGFLARVLLALTFDLEGMAGGVGLPLGPVKLAQFVSLMD
ncbi:hypothetical protein BOTBODRAFT_568011 [Botryobasidium botryosum FD-172 SS1]|uniref:Uncharacterized protein n=1 Tax=Botryobasidium botryosum (strain FD-172 SS1) TaxID=930990 RepID=A0A067LYE2_BOTB1|nr:hypothetical protein BOTBODRAFT_568011 [Botryobasidium botryosum FD-172 SS1]